MKLTVEPQMVSEHTNEMDMLKFLGNEYPDCPITYGACAEEGANFKQLGTIETQKGPLWFSLEGRTEERLSEIKRGSIGADINRQ